MEKKSCIFEYTILCPPHCPYLIEDGYCGLEENKELEDYEENPK